jgi:hypothetical protein
VLVMQVEVEVSQRRACGLMKLYRGTCRYRRRRTEDGRLRTRLRELAEARRRFGYRRLQVLLEREGWQVNHKRVYRLYVEEKLSLRRKRGRKRGTVRQPLPDGSSEPGVVGGLHDRRAELGAEVPNLEHRGRLHARVPGD